MARQEQILRRVVFRPYCAGMGPTFRLVTWDTCQTQRGKTMLGYRLTQHERQPHHPLRPGQRLWPSKQVLFEGEDFGCSPMHAIDSDAAIAGIMAFLTLRPGDTDAEYFEGYTQRQLDYCSEHAEALSSAVENRFGPS